MNIQLSKTKSKRNRKFVQTNSWQQNWISNQKVPNKQKPWTGRLIVFSWCWSPCVSCKLVARSRVTSTYSMYIENLTKLFWYCCLGIHSVWPSGLQGPWIKTSLSHEHRLYITAPESQANGISWGDIPNSPGEQQYSHLPGPSPVYLLEKIVELSKTLLFFWVEMTNLAVD